ncbi:MAG: tRNA 2-thiouridine(34) synthase MnmA [Clostridia bacterium]|nr:tRNA 2-thiouridine(34) synthase MnmA [Clostridia bacterium]
MDKIKVLVAMSGGVDSSAAAALLIEQGYAVSGATMQIWSEDEISRGIGSNEAVTDAKKVAAQLGIEHFTFDFSAEFKENVIAPFISDYLSGRTPNPCIFCNKSMKFGLFFERALEMGFDYIATGHYATIFEDEDGYHLSRSAFDSKDQTYVLYNMNQHILSHLLLPVGNMEKSEIRAYAERAGIEVANKPDSQEICFISDDDYARYIKENSDYEDKIGDFIDHKSGGILGKHKGIIHYTIGQRKGLGIALGEPRFVTQIDAENNRVILGSNEDTFCSSLIAERVNFISGNSLLSPARFTAKTRYSAKPSDCIVTPLENGLFSVKFDSPVRAITPGQSVVFYNENEVVGGGIILKRD